MSIFENGDQPEPEVQPDASKESVSPKHEEPKQFDDLLQGITNSEGKPKYDSVDKALASINPAQQHIRTLETENQDLKSKLEGLTEQVASLQAKVDQQEAIENILDKRQDTFNPEDIDSLLESKISAREAAIVARNNAKQVADSLVERFGDKETAEREFLSLQDELGINLSELAANSPKAVLRYFAKEPAKVPDKFNSNSRVDFQAPQKQTTAEMPKTTTELVNSWREAGELAKEKLGTE